MAVTLPSSGPKAPWYAGLTAQILYAMVLGIALGNYFFVNGSITLGNFVFESSDFKVLADGFIKLIKMVIAPLIFLTVAGGIASMGDLQKVGRVGIKALVYFLIMSLLALIFGVIAVTVMQPGKGLDAHQAQQQESAVFEKAQAQQQAAMEKAKDQHGSSPAEFIYKIIPDGFVNAFTSGNLLSVLFVAILFGIAVAKLGAQGESLQGGMEKLTKVFFMIVHFIMKVAPLGAFGAMTNAIGLYGLAALIPLGKLVIVSIIALLGFAIICLGAVCRYYGFSLWALVKYLREELVTVFGTGSSETVLPATIEKLENLGCSPSVVGLVIPTGFSFNLDGTAVYLSICAMFIFQVFDVHLGFWQIVGLLGVMMLTSKGAAAVTGSGFIVLAATLQSNNLLPPDQMALGLSLLLAIDRIMSSFRAVTNLVGNAVATIAIAKMENEFDESVGIVNVK